MRTMKIVCLEPIKKYHRESCDESRGTDAPRGNDGSREKKYKTNFREIMKNQSGGCDENNTSNIRTDKGTDNELTKTQTLGLRYRLKNIDCHRNTILI